MSVTKTYQRTRCLCGNQRYEAEDWCADCHARSRQSHPKSTDVARRQYTLTPPPSAPGSPQRLRPDSPSATPAAISRPSFASQALTTALSYEDSVPNIFPTTMYRMPDRTRQSSGSQASGLRSPSLPSPPLSSNSHPASIKPPRAPTPEARSQSIGGYSPMAAGFARLNRNNAQSSSSTDVSKLGRPSSTRPSLDLEARMFAGPA